MCVNNRKTEKQRERVCVCVNNRKTDKHRVCVLVRIVRKREGEKE